MAGDVSRSPVQRIVRSAEFQRDDVFHVPALMDAVDLAAADVAAAAVVGEELHAGFCGDVPPGGHHAALPAFFANSAGVTLSISVITCMIAALLS